MHLLTSQLPTRSGLPRAPGMSYLLKKSSHFFSQGVIIFLPLPLPQDFRQKYSQHYCWGRSQVSERHRSTYSQPLASQGWICCWHISGVHAGRPFGRLWIWKSCSALTKQMSFLSSRPPTQRRICRPSLGKHNCWCSLCWHRGFLLGGGRFVACVEIWPFRYCRWNHYCALIIPLIHCRGSISGCYCWPPWRNLSYLILKDLKDSEWLSLI